MDKLLHDTLILLGLSNKEIKFFEVAFKTGPATISEIAKISRLQRSTAYLIAENLIKKNLLEEDFKNYRKIIIAAEPKKLLRILAAKQRVIQRQEIELEENLSHLQGFYQASEIRPKVRVFEGAKGLLSIWKDILSLEGQEIFLWTNQETENMFFSRINHEKFIEERVKKRIFIKVLAVRNKNGTELIKEDAKFLRETRLLPENTIFSSETYIYGNKVAILDYKKDIFGVIIENQQIVSAQKAFFELTWLSFKTFT